MIDRVSELNHQDYLSRPRVSALLAEAARKPLAIVRAGAGCGKTRAVYDFAQGSGLRTAWMQLSGLDNAGSRFWSKYTQLAAGWSGAFTEHCKNLGFPDTEDKLNLHLKQRESYAPEERLIIVLDDIHLVTHPGILRFLEKGLRAEVRNTSVILICRELPDINLSDLRLRGMIPEITEEDLKFTEDELDLYLRLQDLRQSKQNLKDIQADTSGWPFSVNLVARSLKKSPGYSGYVRLAMRSNIFNLMETEVFGACSERLKRFLVKISLIDHLSAELIQTLAGEDCGLLSELRRENAYIRYDNYINAYHIHHLFLDFLRTKQSALPEADRREAYRQAAKWCAANGFESDALTYLENAGDYEGVAEVLTGLPVQMPYDLAQRASEILERAPSQAMESIYMLAVMRIRVVIRLGRWEEAVSLMRAYEERFLSMPAGPFRDRQLGVIYYTWGNLRALMSVSDGVYDFDGYFAKMDKHLTAYPVETDQYADLPVGFWASLCGSEKPGAPQEYITAAERSARCISHSFGGGSAGIDVLCRGELLFYQGGDRAAESVFIDAVSIARGHRQFEIEHKALFYLLRIACWQGKNKKAEQIIKEMEAVLNEEGYAHRFFNHDAALGWRALSLRRPQDLPFWLKEKFSPYSHAYFSENLANQIKARFFYQTRNYPPLLAYISDMKRRESIIYGRVEMLAMEACAFYQMKERAAALDALRAAYIAASSNGIIAPFAELGKDMRTLAQAALGDGLEGVPADWLETVRRLSASFAKYQSLMISEYEKEQGQKPKVSLSERERGILRDLYIGLSRAEIAVKESLSVNTVNSAVNSIFSKLGARGIVDAVRIAAEEKLVPPSK